MPNSDRYQSLQSGSWENWQKPAKSENSYQISSPKSLSVVPSWERRIKFYTVHCFPNPDPFAINSFSSRDRFVFVFVFFWPCHTACKILVPQPGIEPGSMAVKAPCPNHWTAREVPPRDSYCLLAYLVLSLKNLAWLSACLGHIGCQFLLLATFWEWLWILGR